MESMRRLAVIVEDDPDVRNLLRTVLTQSGFETILTSNGEDGVAAVRANDPLLTTLDVSMPGMDGIAAASLIREFSSTYIVMITAQHEEIDVISGLNAGADEFLSKPFRPRELRARIETLLRRPRQTRTPPGVPPNPTDSPQDSGTDLWRRPGSPLLPPGSQHMQGQGPGPIPAPRSTPPMPATYSPSAPHPGGDHPLSTEAPPVVSEPTAAAPISAPIVSTRAQAHIPAVGNASGHPSARDGRYTHHGLVLDETARTVSVDGTPIGLDGPAFELLRTLLSTGRRVRSKADLVLTARGESYVTSYFVTSNDKRNLDVLVESLRRKLGDVTDPPRWIETIDEVGYRMTP